MRNKKIRVVIAYHETVFCPFPENLRKYLLKNYKLDLLYLTHPLLEIKESFKLSSKYEYYESNKLIRKKYAFHWILPMSLLYLKNAMYSFIWCLQFGPWDILFAADSINAFVGIILKKFGRVNKVIYYSMDYYPTRFKNKFLNWIYFQFDRLCVYLADETWNAAEAIQKAREKKFGRYIHDKQFTVPGGIWFNEVARLPFEKIDKRKIVYRGSLHDFTGVDLVINSMPKLLKTFPDLKFEILGGGPYLDYLKKLTIKLGLIDYVHFHGWIYDRKKLEELISDGVIGVATFNTEILDDKIKNADPGKIKDYMVMGMPVILTKAVSFYKKIEKEKAGIVINYDRGEFVKAVTKLLKNEKILFEYRQKALEFIKPLDWNNIFRTSIDRIINSHE